MVGISQARLAALCSCDEAQIARMESGARRVSIAELFVYDSDYYGEELPFWVSVEGRGHLVIPYSLTNNDGKLVHWMGTSDDWFSFVRDAFDMLYQEGVKTPKMVSIGLHMRLIGHLARAMGLARLLDYISARPDVWICKRSDIAKHWLAKHPYPGKGLNE